jgi:ADP-heptose:LPS heptosyltransferase
MRKIRSSQRKLILKNGHAAGDIVVFTAAVRDLHLSHPGRFLTDVRTPCPEFWEHNPYLTPLQEEDKGVEVIDCVPELIRECNQTPYHYIQAYTAFLSSHLKLPVKTAGFHGDIHLSPLEKSWYSQVHELTGEETPFWIIVAGGKRDMTVKWWSSERYQQVVDHFRGKIQFVQVGELHDHHPPLHGVIDLRGKTDLRQLVRLVYHSQGVLCGVTCLAHLAAAVERADSGEHDRPCVVVAGSREPPQWEAYPGQQFIHNIGMLPCSGGGCWRSRVKPLGDGNELDAPVNICKDVVRDLPRCMDMITAADVIRRIEGYFEGGAVKYLTTEQAQAAARAIVPTQTAAAPDASRGLVLNGDLALQRNGHPQWKSHPDITTARNEALEAEGLTLVTLSDDAMAPVARVTGARLREYAARHGYPLIQYEKLLDGSRPAAWNKLLAVRNALLSRQSDWVMWIDADAIVMNLDFPAAALIDERADLICASDHNGLNTGIFLIRYCEWSLRFLESVYFLGEVQADPDGYNPLWEQSTVKHLMRHFPEVEKHMQILPQAAMNSSMQTYRGGDFIVHLSGLSNEDRLRALSSLASNWIEGLAACGGARP